MANDLMLPGGKLPDYLGKIFDEEESNIKPRATVPSLSFTGKVWAISLQGEVSKLTRVDADGERTPLSTIRVIILDYAKRDGRSFYARSYDPANVAPPDCWSSDSIAPDPSVAEPQSPTCNTCKNAVKGSRITDSGKPTVACSRYRLLAVVPAWQLDFPPLRLKIATTSIFDTQNKAQQAENMYAFEQYLSYLLSRGVPNTWAVITKIRFDPDAAFPKLLFSADRVLNAEEIDLARKLARSAGVSDLLSRSWTPAGADGVRTPAIAAPSAPPRNMGSSPALVEDKPQLQPVSPAKGVTSSAPFAKKAPVDDDEGKIEGLSITPTAPREVAKPLTNPPKATPVDMPEELREMLGSWGTQNNQE